MSLAEEVKNAYFVEKKKIREIARNFNLGRETVRRYIRGAEPGKSKLRSRKRPVLETVRQDLEGLLTRLEGESVGKHKLTGLRFIELAHMAGIRAGKTLLSEFFSEYKRKKQEVFVPLSYAPGVLAQVDFFEVYHKINFPVPSKSFMFVMRLMYSKSDFIAFYDRQDQINFFDAHVRAFEYFGVIPRRIEYDNLSLAVQKVLIGSDRELNSNFIRLVQHYGYESNFARPYTGHDKGGVESRGRSIRNNYLFPILSGVSLSEIEETVITKIQPQKQTDQFSSEYAAMLSLPAHPFAPGKIIPCVASSRAMIKIDSAGYSVHEEWHNLKLQANISARSVRIYGPDDRVVEHPRLSKGHVSVNYRHFLKELSRKPQAMRQVAHIAIGQFGGHFPLLWDRLREKFGELRASEFISDILKIQIQIGEEAIQRKLGHALQCDDLLSGLFPRRNETVLEMVIPSRLKIYFIEKPDIMAYDVLLEAGS